jgi:hypothetical protein
MLVVACGGCLFGWHQPVEEINTSSVGLDRLAFGDFNGDGKNDVFSSGRRI